MRRASKPKDKSFLREHSLSIASIGLLALWIVLYIVSDPQAHLGEFYGNAIADWSGSVIIILGTKFLLESGSAESRPVRGHFRNRLREFVHRHSLLIFLGVTGLGWALLYARMDPHSRWGEVVGNLVSEWVQMGGLVFFTKRLVEKGSKESR
jgi:hypothetical protein